MCTNPIYIDNPNVGIKRRSDPSYTQKSNYHLSDIDYYIKDCVSSKIPIPCGHCAACIQLKQSYFVQRCQAEAMVCDLWHCMLSYADHALPFCQINGKKFRFADSRDILLLMKRLRNKKILPDGWRYRAFSEYGGVKHRPHWHILFSSPKIPGEDDLHRLMREKQYHDAILAEWYTNKGSRRRPEKVPNLIYYNRYGRRNYDFHWIDPSLTDGAESDCAFYISKYMTKYDDYVDRLRGFLWHHFVEHDHNDSSFGYYWKLLRPRSLSSHYWGRPDAPEVQNYVRYCIDRSKTMRIAFPCWINPITGQTFPLNPYFRRSFVTVDDLIDFRRLHPELYEDDSGVKISSYFTQEEVQRKEERFAKVKSIISLRDSHPDYYEGKFEQLANDFFNDGKFSEIPNVRPSASDLEANTRDFDDPHRICGDDHELLQLWSSQTDDDGDCSQ